MSRRYRRAAEKSGANPRREIANGTFEYLNIFARFFAHTVKVNTAARHVRPITVHQIRNVQRTIHAKPEFETAVYRIAYEVVWRGLDGRFCLGIGAVGRPDFGFRVQRVNINKMRK